MQIHKILYVGLELSLSEASEEENEQEDESAPLEDSEEAADKNFDDNWTIVA